MKKLFGILLLFLGINSYACICAGMASCLLIEASMSATVAKTIPDFYRTDNQHFYPGLAKVYHLIYTAKKKNEEIANNYTKRKSLTKNLILLDNEEEFIKAMENKIPITQLKILETKIDMLTSEIEMINNVKAKKDLIQKRIKKNNYSQR